MKKEIKKIKETVAYAEKVFKTMVEDFAIDNREEMTNQLDEIKHNIIGIEMSWDEAKSALDECTCGDLSVNEILAETLPLEHQNLRTISALETLIGNINYVDIRDLEKLVAQLPIPSHQTESLFN